MKNLAKVIVFSIFALGALFMFLSSDRLSRIGAATFSEAAVQPTPPKSANAPNGGNVPANIAKATPAMTATPTAPAANTAPATIPSGGKTITKHFSLAQDSQSEYGEVSFDHDSHAFMKYSPDGTSVIGCVECHHTDAPKSALKAPDITSERDEVLTFAVFQKSSQKVSECRTCHFQDGNVPDGKTMPKANGKDMNNQLAYHINCNVCHDAAFKARPELKKKPGFATSKDCAVCHKTS